MKKISVFTARILMSLAVFSATAALADTTADFKRYVDNASSISGQFTQETKVGSKTKKVKGQFVIGRPGKFRWSVEHPYQQLIISDGVKVWLYDKDLNQVTVRQVKDALSSTPAALLLGGDLLDQFSLKDIGKKDGIEWVEAVPKGQDLQFKRMGIGMISGVPVRMDLTDAFDNTTRIDFQNVSNKAVITPDTFKFAPPANADILQQ